jgi:NAD(P)-dependent dehydrogenase (short-subunit alcohol dehydrogenase family)
LVDSKEGAVKAVQHELIASGHRALAVGCDVSDESEGAAMIEQAVASFGIAVFVREYLRLLPRRPPDPKGHM